jgi:hypothetical protein
VPGIDESFANLRGAFPTIAEFQGLHFRYVEKNGSLMIEMRRFDRYFYWLLVGHTFKLIHASQVSKLKRLQPISDSTFTPSHAYDDDATA